MKTFKVYDCYGNGDWVLSPNTLTISGLVTDWVIIDAMGLSNFGCDVRWVGLYTAIVIDSRGESVCMLEKVR